MDKWEILEKNLEDTGVADERERYIASTATQVGFTTVAVVWFVLFFFKFFTGQPTGDISAVFFSGMAAMQIQRTVKDFSKINLGFAIFTTLAALAFAVSYAIEILGA